jgi:hypothetical protein
MNRLRGLLGNSYENSPHSKVEWSSVSYSMSTRLDSAYSTSVHTNSRSSFSTHPSSTLSFVRLFLVMMPK